MSEHTPGPWHAQGVGNTFTISHPASLSKPHVGDHIATVCNARGFNFLSHDEIEANACLIAAAPDLLAEAQYIDSVAPEAIPSDTPDTLITITITARALADLRAAITKARG